MKRDAEDVFEPAIDEPDLWSDGWSDEGVIAVLEPLVGDARKARLEQVIDERLECVTVLLDAPHDPHNASAVLRSSEAFGIQTLHVVTRNEPFVAARRVTKGTQHWVDVVVHPTPEHAVTALREAGYSLVASDPRGQLLPEELRQIPRIALVLGNEHEGIHRALVAAADRTVRIPMRGFVESLNVSVSAAILLAAATRGRAGDLAPEVRRRLYARGLFRSLTRAREVLDALEAR